MNAALGATVPGASKGTVDRRFALRYSHLEDNPKFVTRPSPVSASTVLADRLASQVMEEPPTIARLSGDEAVSMTATEESIGARASKEDVRGLIGTNDPWSWETWGERSQRMWGRHSRTLESLNWAATGALAGLAVAAAPAFFVGFNSYPFVFYQPLGAAIGALLGNLVVQWRWSKSRDGRHIWN